MATVVGRVCSCPALEAQGDAFVDACVAGLDARADADLVTAAEAGCTRCPDSADAPDFLGSCYGKIAAAGVAGDSCEQNTECQSFACCATDVLPALNANGVTVTYTDGCCGTGQTCEGCKSIFARGDLSLQDNPDLVACAESLQLFIDAVACGCDAHRNDPAVPRPCVAACGVLMQCDALSLECRNCLVGAYGDVCPAMGVCSKDPDRPIDPQGAP